MSLRFEHLMILKGQLLRAAKLGLFFLYCLQLTQPASAVELTHGIGDFSNHAYVATGLGLSHLNPDTSEADEDVNDRVNGAGQITIGLDVRDWLSLELHSADLGSAGLFPQGRINYHVHGGSALFYMGKNRDAHARHGLSAYGRTGLGYLQNSSVGTVNFQRVNALHLLFGVGIEYVTQFGLGARAEFISFDNDVFYSQLALVYRFGRKSDRKMMEVVEVEEEVWVAIAEKPKVVPPIVAIAVINPDKDADGVLNESDECPATGVGVPVDDTGCAWFDGIAEGVNFFSNSARLTDDAKAKLNKIVSALSEHRTVKAIISAHTDSWGEEGYNQSLSERRAQSVLDYISQNGIQRSRLQATAFGESKPIATNRDEAGRMRNRRVEIIALKIVR